MDFAKYVSLLKTQGLHFAQLNRLGDPFEGSLSKAEFEHWQQVAAAGEARGDLPVEWRGRYFEVLMRSARQATKVNYVSCWHMNRGESEAMWRLYSSSGYAIAIQSRYQLLVDSLSSFTSRDVHIGPFVGVVQYADYHEDKFPTGNAFHAVMHKRRSFEHEHECRAVIWRTERKGPDGVPDHVLETYPPGIGVSVALAQMIEQVVVAPTAPEWFSSTVIDITTRYGFAFPVRRSSLTVPPYL
jgi:hypothetical protein